MGLWGEKKYFLRGVNFIRGGGGVVHPKKNYKLLHDLSAATL